MIEGGSCVLIYRQYGNETLVVEEYPKNTTVFPVTFPVSVLKNYTLTIFGKTSHGFDEEPILVVSSTSTMMDYTPGS